MARLPRKTQKIFCSAPNKANQTAVFGTMKTTNRQYSTDVATLQSNAAYTQGWNSATIAGYKPFMEEFNTLNYINTSQLAYLFQQGVAEWDSETTYYINSIVKAVTSAGDLKLYRSLTDNNINNSPTASGSIHWTLLTQTDDVANVDLSNLSAAGQLKFDNKMNKDMSNRASNIHFVTQTYQNGTSWYRLYDDNWCEQGGPKTESNSITFLKNFQDTNYFFEVYYNSANNQYAYTSAHYYQTSKTTSGVVLNAIPDTGLWWACGYIAGS